MKNKKTNGDRIVTRTYSGPNRRVSEQTRQEERLTGALTHEERGNQVHESVTRSSRQPYDDETVNLLRILKIDEITLDD